MSAMPERVWVYLKPDLYDPIAYDYKMELHGSHGATAYVPESALLAAEARVREVEAELDAERRGASEIARLAEAEIATLRAERDALVPLAWWGLQEALGFVPEITPPTDEQIAQARAILARETNDG